MHWLLHHCFGAGFELGHHELRSSAKTHFKKACTFRGYMGYFLTSERNKKDLGNEKAIVLAIATLNISNRQIELQETQLPLNVA